MKITYEEAYPHRHALDALATEADRDQMEGPLPSALPSWFYRDTLDCQHHAVLVDGVPVGNIDFGLDDDGCWETGFFIASAWRRKGIIEKAWRELSTEYGSCFTAGCWENNTASILLLAKLGFVCVGTSVHGGRPAVRFLLKR